jgi:hypothetical protein
MNTQKITIALVVVVVLVTGVVLAAKSANPGDFLYPLKTYLSGEVMYIADISHEVDLLEAELKDLDSQIGAGTLDPKAAELARASIISRLERINASAQNGSKAVLTPAMRATLNDALSRLTRILTTYRDSFATVEELASASITTGGKKKSGGSARPKTILEAIEDTAQILEDHIEEVTGENPTDEVVSDDDTPDAETSDDSSEDSKGDMEDMNDEGDAETDSSDDTVSDVTHETPADMADDERLFTFVLNAETVERFAGVDNWTQEYQDYWYVPYQEPSRAPFEKSVRLDEVTGFEYDPAYDYTITIGRTQSNAYGAEDAGWFNFKLVSIDEKTLRDE